MCVNFRKIFGLCMMWMEMQKQKTKKNLLIIYSKWWYEHWLKINRKEKNFSRKFSFFSHFLFFCWTINLFGMNFSDISLMQMSRLFIELNLWGFCFCISNKWFRLEKHQLILNVRSEDAYINILYCPMFYIRWNQQVFFCCMNDIGRLKIYIEIWLKWNSIWLDLPKWYVP